MCSGNPDGGRAVEGSVVYVPCPNGVTAIKVSTKAPYLARLWTAHDGAGGGPIIADGLVWTIGGTAVDGLNPATGQQVVSIPFGRYANHFPTPSVGDGLLLLPGANQVFAFMGPAGLPPTPPPGETCSSGSWSPQPVSAQPIVGEQASMDSRHSYPRSPNDGHLETPALGIALRDQSSQRGRGSPVVDGVAADDGQPISPLRRPCRLPRDRRSRPPGHAAHRPLERSIHHAWCMNVHLHWPGLPTRSAEDG